MWFKKKKTDPNRNNEEIEGMDAMLNPNKALSKGRSAKGGMNKEFEGQDLLDNMTYSKEEIEHMLEGYLVKDKDLKAGVAKGVCNFDVDTEFFKGKLKAVLDEDGLYI